MAKKKNMGGSNESPFEGTARPNNDWAYADGMVWERAGEFGSAPMREQMSRYPHEDMGIASMGAHLEDGPSGMDRHVAYIVPAGKRNLFKGAK